jgi:Arc/MetJ-type ribon-helix-helix transcriptional regulator
MPHNHPASKAEAIHDAIEHFQEEHHHAPDAHEKARLVSDTIKEWEHEQVEEMHSADKAA